MIIVTGATGFIGSNLLVDLNMAGRTDIILVDELGCEGKWKNIAKRHFQDVVLPSELDTLLGKLTGCDVVYHMGAISSTTVTDGDEVMLKNFRASKTLWEWCYRTKTPLIYASSAATYGDGAAGFDDDQSWAALDRLRPLNLYGWSKHAFDKWALAQAAVGSAPPQWCGMKFFNVYGPNENHKGQQSSLVCKNTQLVAADKTIDLFKSYRPDFADGQQLRDFVYVKDCVRVMLWLAAHPKISGLFNLGTGVARSFVDLVQSIGRAMNKSVAINFVDMPEQLRPNYQYFTQAKMRKLIDGYDTPFFGLEEGVADYVQKYLLQPDIYR